MAHCDEERDKQWVEMLRRVEKPYPHIKPVIDAFEQTGDTIHFSAAINMFRAAWHQEDIE